MIKLLAAVAVLLSLSPAIAAPPPPPPGGPRGQLPPHGQAEFPQSAYAACAGKAIGDTATDGQISGTCQSTMDHRVALRPNGPPPKGAPPPPPPPPHGEGHDK